MKSKANFVIVLFYILSISGCATGPSFHEYSSKIQSVSSDNGRIYIYRASIAGGIVKPDVHVNGRVVGKAIPRGFFYIDRPTGFYTIATYQKQRNTIISHGSTVVNLESGEEVYISLELHLKSLAEGHIKPYLVHSSIGKEEIKKTRYIGE